MSERAPTNEAAASRPEARPAEPSGLLPACLILLVLSAVLIAVGLPVGFLVGSADFWTQPKGDIAEHLVGANDFLADRWRLPLLLVPWLGTPNGTNIALTDSLPLLAILAKAFASTTGVRLPYIPLWLGLCGLLQAPSAAIALHSLGVRRISLLVAGGLVLLFTPVLLLRFGHPALCGQFLILLAIALHFHITRGPPIASPTPGRFAAPSGAIWLYAPLLIATVLVHVYLFAIVFAMMAATILTCLYDERITIPQASILLVATAALLAAVLALCGYLSLGSVPTKPYGDWPLDLAAPFTPSYSALFGPQPPSGFESFAWIGAGAALLIVASLIVHRRHLASSAERHLPLLTVVAAVLVFAITYNVRINDHLVLGLSSDILRRVALAGGEGGVVHRLLAALQPADYLRIALYGLVLAGIAGLILGSAWRARRFRFLRFLAIAAGLVIVVALVRPGLVALAVSSFQASARFVWLPLYLAELVAIAALARRLAPLPAVLLLSFAMLLQVYDTMPAWRFLQHEANAVRPAGPDRTRLRAAIEGARTVTLVPSYLCAFGEPVEKAAFDELVERIVDIQFLVSLTPRPINSVRHSRMTASNPAILAEACESDRRTALATLHEPGGVLIVLNGAPAEASLAYSLRAMPICESIPDGLLCGASR